MGDNKSFFEILLAVTNGMLLNMYRYQQCQSLQILAAEAVSGKTDDLCLPDKPSGNRKYQPPHSLRRNVDTCR